ncbi:MAG: hypothetical protein M3Q56_12705 [Bacteroidota bacterium]|nr:hypothetical protein [Bacteroidota bacterium]
MKLIILLIVSCLIGFSSCAPGGNITYGAKALAARKDCSGPCNKPMPCEGKELTLEMNLGNNNVMTTGSSVFVRDPENFDVTVRINFSETLSPELYGSIKDPKYKKFRVTGIVEGYDQYVQEVCTRSYIFKVTDQKNFKLMEN